MATSFRHKPRRGALRDGNNHTGNGTSPNNGNPRLASRLLQISRFRGIYSRVARKLRVDRSLVSRVARGERKSKRVSKALLAELHAIKLNGRG